MLSYLLKKSGRFGRIVLELVNVYFRNKPSAFMGLKFPRGTVPPNWSFDAMASSRIRIRLWEFLPGELFNTLFERISMYWASSAKSGALRPDLWDLLQQARLMNFLSPARTIEFGSGNSSVVGLLCSREFISVDGSEHFASKTRDFLASAGFSSAEVEKVKYAPVNLHVWPSTKETVWLHEIPLESADFIYVDGPALSEQSSVAADIVEQKLAHDQTVILFDSRKDNAIWLQRELNSSGSDWQLMVLPYPSNDCLLINSAHSSYRALVDEFFLSPGGESPGAITIWGR